MHYLRYMLTIAFTVLVFYYSWVPYPDIGTACYFPKVIGRWINEYGNIRTAIPFLILGSISEMGFVNDVNAKSKRVVILASLLILVICAELGQLFLPFRHFDYMDIFWGFCGSTIGMLVMVFVKNLKIMPSFLYRQND